MKISRRSGVVLAAAAAALFSAGVVTVTSTADAAGVHCTGANACKGQSACKSATNSCKGQNACKGQGWVETSSADECTAKGGKVAS